ncbi:DUF2290 domain-containing protein [Caulobacter segnis]
MYTLYPEIRVSQHPPLVRYEYAPSQYVELNHPCSHFHFGHHSDNRWAVKRELTPQAFSSLIYRQFYSTNWVEFGVGDPAGGVTPLDEQFRTERQNSQILGEAHFSAIESQSFHFL